MSVKIEILKEFSKEISEKVRSVDNKNNDKKKTKRDKKYLLISFLSKLISKKGSLFITIFLGLKCKIKSFKENLNNENNLKNLNPELVEKKEPPIITNIKKTNERFGEDCSKEIPILEILLVKDNKITLKSYLKSNSKKNKEIKKTKYISKNISS